MLFSLLRLQSERSGHGLKISPYMVCINRELTTQIGQVHAQFNSMILRDAAVNWDQLTYSTWTGTAVSLDSW